jgi:hypothetical protein
MMIVTSVLCAIAAGILVAVVINLSSMGILWAFLASWLVAAIGGGALHVVQAAARDGVATLAKSFFAMLVPALILGIGLQAFIDHWKGAEGLLATVFLVWLGILAFMILFVPYVGAERESGPADIGPPPT